MVHKVFAGRPRDGAVCRCRPGTSPIGICSLPLRTHGARNQFRFCPSFRYPGLNAHHSRMIMVRHAIMRVYVHYTVPDSQREEGSRVTPVHSVYRGVLRRTLRDLTTRAQHLSPLFVPSGQREVEADVESGRGVRERPDRDEVNASGGDLRNPLQRDAAGCLQQRVMRVSITNPHRLGHR